MSNFELTSFNPLGRCDKVLSDPREVEARLQALSADLASAIFRYVVIAGLGSRNDTTRASAVTASGLKQWLSTVESLRDRLAAKEWRIHDEKNCPFISSPDGRISIVVMTGDLETGREGFGEPTNQAEKGAVVEGFVRNNYQLELFNAMKNAKEQSDATQVWAFMYHYDKKLKEVRFEFSYPTRFTKTKISGWGERLILGFVPNNPSTFIPDIDSPNLPPTVEVEPKGGVLV